MVLEHRRSVSSTSGELMRRAREGEAGPLWLVADEQTAGRGRRSREWSSPPGNLYASLLLPDPAPPEAMAELSLALALALHDAVAAAAGPDTPPAELKWPNDLMIAGRKCAGILLEGGLDGRQRFAVAGFGVNIVSHPEGTDHPASNLGAEGYRTDRDELFARLSAAVPERLAEWNRGAGLGSIRRQWLGHAYGLGRPMRITTTSESYLATVKGLDAKGRLLVTREGAEEAVSAGEVFELHAAPEPAS